MSYQTITSFTDIVEHTLPGTLIALDLDETIMTLPNEVGTKSWWDTVYQHHFDKTGDHNTADDAAYQVWKNHAIENDPSHTDEDGLTRLFEEAIGAGNIIIGITARAPPMQETTERHLETLGIVFDNVDISQHVCTNARGVFYVGDDSKADVLMSVCSELRNNGRKISRVIFVDDVEKNVQTVSDALDVSDMIGHCYLARLTG